MKYHIITYGCQMNCSDSERIATVFEKVGYKKALKIDRAGLIIVNMCSVRQSAVDRIYGLIPKFNKLKTTNYKLQTILTGCILKKDRKKLAQHFDYILDIKDLSKANLEIEPRYSCFPLAYIPISTGCNYFCSYCVIPYTRGSEVCRAAEDILIEAKNLIDKGYKEIWLLGQNVNSYRNKNINFPKLLKMLNNIPGNFWIRFTSPQPRDFSNELIEIMTECEKISPYLNLPVQSGDNEILKKMNRNYKIEEYRELVKKIRKKIPDITLSTDVIVGFPGETKTQFKNTVNLLKEIKYDMAYISQYSVRPGTAAAKMEDNVPKPEKKERERILTEILKQTALDKNKTFIGVIVEVLPLKWNDDFIIAKSFHYKTVKFKSPKDIIGKFVKIKVINALSWGLQGQSLKKVPISNLI